MAMQRWLTAAELRERTGIAKSTLLHMAQADRIPHVRIDGFVRFPEREVEAWIRERTRGGEGDAGQAAG